mgnify:CR=1 FL=1
MAVLGELFEVAGVPLVEFDAGFFAGFNVGPGFYASGADDVEFQSGYFFSRVHIFKMFDSKRGECERVFFEWFAADAASELLGEVVVQFSFFWMDVFTVFTVLSGGVAEIYTIEVEADE